jgi:hypothetical protein
MSLKEHKVIRKYSLPVFLILVTGCAGSNSPPEDQLVDSTQSTDAIEIVIGTGGAKGLHYPTGRAICRMVNQFKSEHGVSCEAQTTEGTIFNINAVVDGSLALGLGRSDWIYRAYRGKSRWLSTPRENIRTIFGVLDESVHVLAKSNLTNISDLKGKKVNIGEPDTLFRSAAIATLAAYDLTAFDIQVFSVNPYDAFRLLRKGEVDAIIYTAGDPSGITNQTLKSGGITIIPVEDPEASRIIENNPFYVKTAIDTSWYPNSVKEQGPVPTVGYKTILFTVDETPEEIVYQLTRAIFENLGKFKEQHTAYKTLTRESMINGLQRAAPIHPGALRYFREIGLM